MNLFSVKKKKKFIKLQESQKLSRPQLHTKILADCVYIVKGNSQETALMQYPEQLLHMTGRQGGDKEGGDKEGGLTAACRNLILHWAL